MLFFVVADGWIPRAALLDAQLSLLPVVLSLSQREVIC
jgi:hypothetical protein